MHFFGDVIRELMERRRLSGRKLGKAVGISPTSISNILNGKSKPRQLTLTRLIKQLCTTAEEEQMIIRAMTGLIENLPNEPVNPQRPIPDDELERVTRYIEIKSMAVAFQKDVEAVLVQIRTPYEKDFRAEPFICDFFLKISGRRLAIDCKYNVNRDWDRTYATVKLLIKNLPCDEVIIVVPYENDLARKARIEIESIGGQVLDVKTLAEFFKIEVKAK